MSERPAAATANGLDAIRGLRRVLRTQSRSEIEPSAELVPPKNGEGRVPPRPHFRESANRSAKRQTHFVFRRWDRAGLQPS